MTEEVKRQNSYLRARPYLTWCFLHCVGGAARTIWRHIVKVNDYTQHFRGIETFCIENSECERVLEETTLSIFGKCWDRIRLIDVQTGAP